MLEIAHGNAIAAECTGAGAILLLELGEIGLVQNKGFQFVQDSVQFYLNPTVEYVFRRKPIDQSSHRALLQRFVDGGSVNSAGNVAGAEQCHKQRSLRVALAIAV